MKRSSTPGGSRPPSASSTPASGPKRPASSQRHVIGGSKLPPSIIQSTASRLAKPTGRVEYLDTPGPYNYNDGRDKGRIPYVIGTNKRWPAVAAPMKDRIECDRSAIEPKPIVAIFTTEGRWGKDQTVTKNASNYDVEAGYRATEPRPFVATLSGKAIEHKIIEEKPRVNLDTENHLTIAHSSVKGGNMSHCARDTIESFLLHTESPGPVYNPSYEYVEPQSGSGVFSSQLRLPTQHNTTPSPLAYADSVHQASALSTRPRSPNCIIGSVPKVFPLPFNVFNVCNSRSMRTKLCHNSRDVIGTEVDPEYGASGKVPEKYVMSGHRRSRSPSTVQWTRPESVRHRPQSQQSIRSGGVPEQSPAPRGPNDVDGKSSQQPMLLSQERDRRWINNMNSLRRKEQDPRRFVVADSPFSSKHYVPPNRRTVVLCEEEELGLEEELLKRMGTEHVHVAPGSSAGSPTLGARPATAGLKGSKGTRGVRPTPSKAVERFRTNVVNAQTKRYGEVQEEKPAVVVSPTNSERAGSSVDNSRHRSGSSPTRSPPHGALQEEGDDLDAVLIYDPASTHPRAVQYENKFPVLSLDESEGYHSKVFQSHVQNRLDEALLPESKRNVIATGCYRWDTAKKAKELAGQPMQRDEFGRVTGRSGTV